jgi:hypothetical protein
MQLTLFDARYEHGSSGKLSLLPLNTTLSRRERTWQAIGEILDSDKRKALRKLGGYVYRQEYMIAKPWTIVHLVIRIGNKLYDEVGTAKYNEEDEAAGLPFNEAKGVEIAHSRALHAIYRQVREDYSSAMIKLFVRGM